VVVDPDAGIGPSWLVFSRLGIAATSSVRVGFEYGNEWVFVDEVTFDGARVVAEPWGVALHVLVLVGMTGIGHRQSRKHLRRAALPLRQVSQSRRLAALFNRFSNWRVACGTTASMQSV